MDSYGLNGYIVKEQENSDKLGLFTAENKIKILRVEVDSGSIESPKLKLRLQKRIGNFEYLDIENVATNSEIFNIGEVNEVSINTSRLEEGIYRVVIDLVDESEKKYTDEFVNF